MIGSGLNRLRRIATADGWQVERRWHAGVLEELGVDMHVEVAAQRLAAQHGLAPPVLEFDPQARVLRMPWVDGVPLEADWPRRAVRRAAMRELLERLRAVPAPHLPRLDLPARVRALHGRLALRDAARADGHSAALHEAIVDWRRAQEPTDATAEAAAHPAGQGVAPCLVHGDLTPGNVIVCDGGALLLLDWEYAHAGGPWDELAALCPAASGDLSDWMAIVPGAARHRFEATRRLRRLLDALWYDLAATLSAAAPAGGPQAGIRPRTEAH